VNFQLIPLAQIAESKTNPRKTFDKDKLTELAESIREKGVLQPILVRPLSGHSPDYELVAGARRFRASLLAGFDSIPAVVRDLTAIEVLELQVIENKQREDVDPLEQADGYAALVKQGKYIADTIALKIGRSPAYVRQRISLTTLIKAARKKLTDGEMTISAGMFMGRLDAATQKVVLNDCRYGTISREMLVGWVERQARKVKDACFDTKSTTLVIGAPACSTCDKNTAVNTSLFEDDADRLSGRCTDRQCWDNKVAAHLSARVADGLIPIYHGPIPKDAPKGALKYYGGSVDTYGVGNAPKSEHLKGIYMDGWEVGKTLVFVMSKEGQQSERKLSAQEAAMKRETKFRNVLYKEIVSRGGVDTDLAFRLLARRAFQAMKGNPVYSALGWKPIQGDYDGSACFEANIGETSVEAVAVAIACASELTFWNHQDMTKMPLLTEVAEALGIDINARRIAFAKEQAEKAAKAKPAKKPKAVKK
jgi:ParB/RepB/Spo0J family partition protein